MPADRTRFLDSDEKKYAKAVVKYGRGGYNLYGHLAANSDHTQQSWRNFYHKKAVRKDRIDDLIEKYTQRARAAAREPEAERKALKKETGSKRAQFDDDDEEEEEEDDEAAAPVRKVNATNGNAKGKQRAPASDDDAVEEDTSGPEDLAVLKRLAKLDAEKAQERGKQRARSESDSPPPLRQTKLPIASTSQATLPAASQSTSTSVTASTLNSTAAAAPPLPKLTKAELFAERRRRMAEKLAAIRDSDEEGFQSPPKEAEVEAEKMKVDPPVPVPEEEEEEIAEEEEEDGVEEEEDEEERREAEREVRMLVDGSEGGAAEEEQEAPVEEEEKAPAEEEEDKAGAEEEQDELEEEESDVPKAAPKRELGRSRPRIHNSSDSDYKEEVDEIESSSSPPSSPVAVKQRRSASFHDGSDGTPESDRQARAMQGAAHKDHKRWQAQIDKDDDPEARKRELAKYKLKRNSSWAANRYTSSPAKAKPEEAEKTKSKPKPKFVVDLSRSSAPRPRRSSVPTFISSDSEAPVSVRASVSRNRALRTGPKVYEVTSEGEVRVTTPRPKAKGGKAVAKKASPARKRVTRSMSNATSEAESEDESIIEKEVALKRMVKASAQSNDKGKEKEVEVEQTESEEDEDDSEDIRNMIDPSRRPSVISVDTSDVERRDSTPRAPTPRQRAPLIVSKSPSKPQSKGPKRVEAQAQKKRAREETPEKIQSKKRRLESRSSAGTRGSDHTPKASTQARSTASLFPPPSPSPGWDDQEPQWAVDSQFDAPEPMDNFQWNSPPRYPSVQSSLAPVRQAPRIPSPVRAAPSPVRASISASSAPKKTRQPPLQQVTDPQVQVPQASTSRLMPQVAIPAARQKAPMPQVVIPVIAPARLVRTPQAAAKAVQPLVKSPAEPMPELPAKKPTAIQRANARRVERFDDFETQVTETQLSSGTEMSDEEEGEVPLARMLRFGGGDKPGLSDDETQSTRSLRSLRSRDGASESEVEFDLDKAEVEITEDARRVLKRKRPRDMTVRRIGGKLRIMADRSTGR